jgi:tRNA (guanosine-2'-O-)-methyltransferase
MRRNTPGVVGVDALVPALISRVERFAAKAVIERLEPFVLDRRRERLLSAIGARLESVQVVFDAPHDPHNGAAVLRSCEAFGVQHVHVVERLEPFLSAVSVSRGAEKWVDVHRWGSADDAVSSLEADGLELIGARPDGELAPEDLASIPRVCLVLGNERDGIAGDLAAACSRSVRVPMRGLIESLNVSVTAAILLAYATNGRAGDLSEQERDRLYARGLYFTVDKAERILEDLDAPSARA